MPDTRTMVRMMVAIAALAPAIALMVVGGALAVRGGGPGVFAGTILFLMGLGLVAAAIMLVRAPEAALWFLKQPKRPADGSK